MKISAAEVRETAALARLALSDEEVESMRRELEAILGYMERLAAVDVTNVNALAYAVEIELSLRDDLVGPALSIEQALSGAPRREGEYFTVPRVLPPSGGR